LLESGDLPGLRRGITMEDFQMEGMLAVRTDKLKRELR
jgi:hypothetical protein